MKKAMDDQEQSFIVKANKEKGDDFDRSIKAYMDSYEQRELMAYVFAMFGSTELDSRETIDGCAMMTIKTIIECFTKGIKGEGAHGK